MKKPHLDFYKPETVVQWLIFLASIGITLSSPAGTRAFLKELHKYLEEKQGRDGRQYKTQQLSQAIYRLKKRKLIKIKKLDNGRTHIELTEKGRKRKIQYNLDRMKIPEQVPWDKKWRILMFDIPESDRKSRDSLTNKLKNLGFIQFQKSVWLFPYPCENEIDFVTEYFSIAEYVNLVTVKMENDKPLRKEFDL